MNRRGPLSPSGPQAESRVSRRNLPSACAVKHPGRTRRSCPPCGGRSPEKRSLRAPRPGGRKARVGHGDAAADHRAQRPDAGAGRSTKPSAPDKVDRCGGRNPLASPQRATGVNQISAGIWPSESVLVAQHVVPDHFAACPTSQRHHRPQEPPCSSCSQ